MWKWIDLARVRLKQLKRHQLELNLGNSQPLHTLVIAWEVKYGARGSVSDRDSSIGFKSRTRVRQNSEEVSVSTDNSTDTVLDILKRRLFDTQHCIRVQEESLCTMDMELQILEETTVLVEIRHGKEIV